MSIKIETKRLILQSLDLSYLEMYYDFLMRNLGFFREWSPKYEENYFDKEYHRKNFEKLEIDTREEKAIKFGIFLKNHPEKIIGTVSFSNIIKGPFLSCFLGYRLDENYTSNGYATEATDRGIEFMFNDIKLHRIEANIIPRNKASIRVAEKLGFIYVGSSRNYLQINGKWEDHLHYVLLNDNLVP